MEENGVWRTVGGRRIFIKEGQDLASAMKESGKFKTAEKKKQSQNKEDERKNKIEELKKELEEAKGFLAKAKIQKEITALEKGYSSYEEYEKGKIAQIEFQEKTSLKIEDKKINDFLEKQKIDVKEYNNDYDYSGYRKDKQNLQENLSKELGYSKSMQKLSKQDYDKYDGIELSRIVNDSKNLSANEIVQLSIDGDIRYSDKSSSYYGKGLYYGDKKIENKLKEEYGKKGYQIINTKISKDANIIEFENMSDYIKGVGKISKQIKDDNISKFYYNNSENQNMLFMNAGIDVIKIKKDNYYVILNRGKLITYVE